MTGTDMTRGLYRRIYAGFITGKRICAVSLEAEAWFWRIHAVVDDLGNTLADPVLLRNATVGRRGDVTAEQVSDWVAELVKVRLVSLYEHEGDKYLHINDFSERQPAGRNGKRIQRHPGPSSPIQGEDGQDEVNPGESKCIQVNPGDREKSKSPHSHSHSHNHSQSEGVVGEPKGTNGDGVGDDPLVDEVGWSKCWIAANMPSFLRSGVAPFSRLIKRLGKEKAIAAVEEARSDPNVGNPFAYIEAKLDRQHAEKKSKPPPRRVTKTVTHNV